MPTTETILTADTQYGEISYFGFDAPIGDALRLYGGWATSEIQFLRQFIVLGDTVVDGGANIGTHTMAFADACGPEGCVVAIEASPEVSTLLQKNVEKNALKQVKVVSAAVGAAAGICVVDRVNPGRPQNTGIIQPLPINGNDGSGLRTPMITLDSLDLQRLSLLKLDIEGGEMAALQGGLETVKKLRPIIMIEVLNLSSSLPIMTMLTSLEYKPFFCSFPAFDPENYRGATENIFGVARECGLLFVPDLSTVPVSTPGAYVAAIANVDELARLIAEMPRYGDLTDHDRVSTIVVQERNQAQKALAAATTANQEENHASMEEIHHIWHSLDKMKATWEDTVEKENESISEARADIEHLRTAFDQVRGDVGKTHKYLQDSRTELDKFRKEISESREEIDVTIAQLKAEITSLRASLFDRYESRGQFALKIESLDDRFINITNEISALKSRNGRNIFKKIARWIKRNMSTERK